MAIREKAVNDERDRQTENLDDLDVLYVERMREDGVDEALIEQFASLLKNTKDDEQ